MLRFVSSRLYISHIQINLVSTDDMVRSKLLASIYFPHTCIEYLLIITYVAKYDAVFCGGHFDTGFDIGEIVWAHHDWGWLLNQLQVPYTIIKTFII